MHAACVLCLHINNFKQGNYTYIFTYIYSWIFTDVDKPVREETYFTLLKVKRNF